MNKNIEEYKKDFWEKEQKDFLEMMNEFLERYKKKVDPNFVICKDKYNRGVTDEQFGLWHIIKDAYDMGLEKGDSFWRELFFELTDAEEHFREKVRREI